MWPKEIQRWLFLKVLLPDDKYCFDGGLFVLFWQIGSVRSTSLSNVDCKSNKKSCLNRVNFPEKTGKFQFLGIFYDQEGWG